MGWTDRHFRYLLRLISKGAWLYSEMLPVQTLLRSREPAKRIDFHSVEHPLALQLGGDDPSQLSRAAHWGWKAGYDEINLNIGCPSPRVLQGRFGVCLMEHPEQVGALVASIRRTVPIAVTVKCRLGFDHHVHPSFLETFVQTVAAQGCRTFFVHARQAWLDGVSPKANRSLPPLDYESVIRLKKKYPDLEIVINGGITDCDEARYLLTHVDGVMVGRKVLEDPLWLASLEEAIGIDRSPMPSRMHLIENYGTYVSHMLQSSTEPQLSMHRLFQPLQTVIRGFPGAARIRQMVCQAGRAAKPNGCAWIDRILEQLSDIAPQSLLALEHAPSPSPSLARIVRVERAVIPP
ncbi:tRNA-dihydrouridine synthase A [mine drainage metagenome]|uniref:tRNA-dihydrouridine synthase A n=1 Tax=mine drainage metagenome TaxID=410659 RepID=T0YMH0_9ZZZZ